MADTRSKDMVKAAIPLQVPSLAIHVQTVALERVLQAQKAPAESLLCLQVHMGSQRMGRGLAAALEVEWEEAALLLWRLEQAAACLEEC